MKCEFPSTLMIQKGIERLCEVPGGKVVNWRFEMGPPNALLRMGWRKDSVPPGTPVEIQGFRAKNGEPVANAKQVKLPDGRELFSGGSAPVAQGASGAEKKQ
jgi:hypothetical protein